MLALEVIAPPCPNCFFVPYSHSIWKCSSFHFRTCMRSWSFKELLGVFFLSHLVLVFILYCLCFLWRRHVVWQGLLISTCSSSRNHCCLRLSFFDLLGYLVTICIGNFICLYFILSHMHINNHISSHCNYISLLFMNHTCYNPFRNVFNSVLHLTRMAGRY